MSGTSGEVLDCLISFIDAFKQSAIIKIFALASHSIWKRKIVAVHRHIDFDKAWTVVCPVLAYAA